MRSSLLQDLPHRRLNALSGEWVFVSPHRTLRPWQGRQESTVPASRPRYDTQCYLCPGNERAGGAMNPMYVGPHVFTNDFPAFLPDNECIEISESDLMQAQTQAGICRVMAYSPRHDLTLAQMSTVQVGDVIDTWVEQSLELGGRWRWVQIFENKGEVMGCSNAHPHGQIWASNFVPEQPAKECMQQMHWFQSHSTLLLLDYALQEINANERIVFRNDHWIAVVPWWAVWPYETLVLPLRAVNSLVALTEPEKTALAQLLCSVTSAYDRLFETSFPYSFGWHAAPTGEANRTVESAVYQLHAHFYPPLLRSATIKKFMVGYEMLAESQRDLTPERAAERLRSLMR